MNDGRARPDEARDEKSNSKLIDVEGECSVGVGSSSV